MDIGIEEERETWIEAPDETPREQPTREDVPTPEPVPVTPEKVPA